MARAAVHLRVNCAATRLPNLSKFSGGAGNLWFNCAGNLLLVDAADSKSEPCCASDLLINGEGSGNLILDCARNLLLDTSVGGGPRGIALA